MPDLRNYDKLFGIIRFSLWNTGICEADQAVFDEMKQHAIIGLPAYVLGEIRMPESLRKEWKTFIYQQLLDYNQYIYKQNEIPLDVPYAILKGTSAAQYYPHPECRSMGDIDIITRPEDYKSACDTLIHCGFQEMTYDHDIMHTRHREFCKENCTIEVHLYYPKMNDIRAEKKLDSIIRENICPSHVLPDMINGLVLLEHISRHLESGLGLRQIIDWMMFVDKCLPDRAWPAFQPLVHEIGLEKLAVVTTGMCERYLGLEKRSWSAAADIRLCDDLLSYVMECGNFGCKQQDNTKIVPRVFSFTNNIKGLFTALQNKGLKRWRLAQKYMILRPFAWLYQLFYYLKSILFRKKAISSIVSEYREGKNRSHLFEQLGVLETSKRNVFFKDSL